MTTATTIYRVSVDTTGRVTDWNHLYWVVARTPAEAEEVARAHSEETRGFEITHVEVYLADHVAAQVIGEVDIAAEMAALEAR